MKFFVTILLALSLNVYAQHKTNIVVDSFGNETLKNKIEIAGSSMLTEFNSAFKEKRELNFNRFYISESGINTIDALWKSNPFYCDVTQMKTKAIKRPDKNYEIRDIPIIIQLEDGKLHTEEGVLLFSGNGTIINMYFGLKTQRYQSLLKGGKSVADFRRRQVILDFIENYRTAYNRKDLQYIEDVFSDNALIIVGKVIKRKHDSPDYISGSFSVEQVKYIRHSKKSYISALSKNFHRNKFINVGFDEIDIFMHPVYKQIYGVTLLQHWASSNYSDSGYLFLMIDFKDDRNPIIHVRTWQPEKYVTRNDVFSLGDFEIIE